MGLEVSEDGLSASMLSIFTAQSGTFHRGGVLEQAETLQCTDLSEKDCNAPTWPRQLAFWSAMRATAPGAPHISSANVQQSL